MRGRHAARLRAGALLVASLLLPLALVRAEPMSGEAAPPKTRSLLVLPLTGNNIDPETVATIESFITVELSKRSSFRVLAGAEVKQMLELESEKQAAGCDDSGCIAEIAGALGAELVVIGQVGRLERRLLLTLTLFEPARGQAINRVTVKADELDALPEQLEVAVARLVDPGSQPADPQPAAPQPAAAVQGNPGPWIVTASGGALVVAGLGLAAIGAMPWVGFVNGKGQLSSLEQDLDPALRDDELMAIAAAWQETENARAAWNGWGVWLVRAGVVAAAAGVVTSGVGAGWWLVAEGEAE